MSPYCSAHDELLIMKLFMYVGYHDANNVAHFGGDTLTRLNYLRCFTDMALHSRDAVTPSAAVAPRSRADVSSREARRRKYIINVLYNTIKWPYQPKHSPSFSKAQVIVRSMSYFPSSA